MFKEGDKVYLNPEVKFNLPQLRVYQEDYPDELWTVKKYDGYYGGYTIYHPKVGTAHGVSENKLIHANELNLIKVNSQMF